MKLIETHAHIYDKQFAQEQNNIIDRALDAGIENIYMPNIGADTIDGMLELELHHPEVCVPMMGLHPGAVDKHFEKSLYIIEDWLQKRAFAAVGEIGIDLYWDKTFKAQQMEAFSLQISWAKKLKIPIVIHCRDAFEETITVVEAMKDDNLQGIFHCFSGTVAEAKRIAALDFKIGIGGVVTFKNGGLAERMPKLPIEQMVLETDSPYLAPKPFRGKRNEPSYLKIIAEKIAELKNISREEVASLTTKNAMEVFQS